jgi:hypothetical protein
MKRIITSFLIAVGFASLVQAQSVADFARQERARRAGSEAKIKITNDNLTAAPKTDAAKETKPEAPQTAAETAPAKTTGPVDSKGRDEKWWRSAFADARSDLKHAEDQIKVIQGKLNQAHLDYLQKSDLYNRELRIGAEINTLNAQLEAEQKNAEKAQKKIDDLEDELRRSGGLPGWAR